MDWKKFCRKALFPPIWIIVILVLVSAAALGYVFVRGMEQSIVAYIVYALAFYALSVLCIFCTLVLPKQYRQIKQKIYANPLGNRFLTDRAFQDNVSLRLSFTINLLYAGLHIWSWHRFQSYWFVVLAVYYGILAVMRLLLVRYVHIQKIGTSILKEWKRAKACACILLLVNLSLSGAVLMILYQSKGYDYPGILIYVMALYTFYSTIHATVDIVKYRKLGSPVMTAAKVVSLSAALVSMLNLETAMFAQFGRDMAPENQRIFIILTGAGVSIIIVAMSAMLIANANREIRRTNNGT
jgi:hypothetical protein